MTTCATDGKTLATDRQVTFTTPGGIRLAHATQKLFPLEDNNCFQAAAFAGNTDYIYQVLMVLESNDYQALDVEGEFEILLIDWLGGAWSMNKSMSPLEVDTPWATGSGGEIALGAIKAGATAEEAVRIASEVDLGTGKGIDVYEIIAL